MRHVLACLVLLATVPASAQSTQSVWQRTVNLYATVRSADGYVNLRSSPSAQQDNVVGRLRNGERVLVMSCQDRAAGRRWCSLRRTGAGRSASVLAYDSELVYERQARPTSTTAAGAGVARGFTMSTADGYVRSADGYLNLRSSPSSRDGRVIRRLSNDAGLQFYACEARRPSGSRWCLAEAFDEGSAATPVVLGYVYDAEVVYMHDHEDGGH